MHIILTILSINLVVGLITEHLLWIHATREEKIGEYYRHPFFEPIWGEFQDWLLNMASILMLCIVGILDAVFSLFCIINHQDAFTVYVELLPNAELKKNKRWRFWRWGIYKLHSRITNG